MGLAVLAAVVVVSLLVGAAVQARRPNGPPYDFLIVGVTGAFGAYFASETFPGSSVFEPIKNFGPSIDGFYLIPGIVFGVVIAAASYLGTRDTYSPSTAAA